MKSKKPTRAPTLEDVARSAGLSPMTVSRALNTPQLVRPKTVEKVMQAVQATGYIPNALAGGLASRRSKLVAVVVPQINNNMFVDTIQALSDTTPVVEIWDLTPTPLDMLVGFSHEKVGETIGEYVLEKGYQRPGLLWAGDARAMLRKQGLCARLAKKGLDDAPQVEVPLPASLALGRRGLAELLAASEFDVIICSSDTLAQGAIMEAESRGLRVPQDLAVIGFGDLDFAASNRPAITTVSVDRHAIGERAATLLADRIEGGDDSGVIIDIGFQLVARESA